MNYFNIGNVIFMKNERADTLAKFGATRQQTDIPTSYAAARTAIAETGRERWLRRWAASSKSYEYSMITNRLHPDETLGTS